MEEDLPFLLIKRYRNVLFLKTATKKSNVFEGRKLQFNEFVNLY